ncbi:MAG: twin-arginine translocation signal domain-containing protein, partial [Desulfobacterales bacterium]
MNKDKTRRKTWMEDFLGDIKMSRRSFIKASTATGAAVAVGSGLKPELKALAVAAQSGAGEMGQWLSATCQGCTSWCSKQVYVIDGRAVKVRGNPHSKVNNGAGCPRSHLGIQQVYDPDRIKTP